MTGIIARAACNARRIPLISASSAEEVEGARRDPALLARLEREWGTSDLLLVHDADTLDEVRRRSGRHADRIQELLDRGEDAESARRCADHLLEAWDRAALRGPVRSRQAGTGDGAEFRNRL
ncbi:MAG: hypothetical protein ISR76_11195 [Planctomycetes bacterium]|nr:hypothetical protein [Planctomycetota bacterium]